jgi:hypothetical protein
MPASPPTGHTGNRSWWGFRCVLSDSPNRGQGAGRTGHASRLCSPTRNRRRPGPALVPSDLPYPLVAPTPRVATSAGDRDQVSVAMRKSAQVAIKKGSGTHFVIGSGATRHAGLRICLRSRSKLARPYIWRLIVLMRFTVCPRRLRCCSRW